MNYIDKYQISIKRIIGRMIPYFMKGKKLYAILYASLSPITSLHDSFITWAKDVLFRSRLPFHVLAIEWRLNKMLKEEFGWIGGGCRINRYAHQNYTAMVYSATNPKTPDFYVFLFSEECDENNVIYSRSLVSANTAYNFNVEIPKFGTAIMQEQIKLRIRNIISDYTIIEHYEIFLKEL